MLDHISNEPSKTNSCTITQDPYPWKISINIMQLRDTTGYTSQVANCRVDQEWGMRMLIKITKSPTKTDLRTISSQVYIRWLPLGLPTETINHSNKYFSNPREISITTISKYSWAPITNHANSKCKTTISRSIQLMINVLNTKKLNQDQC